MMVTTVSRALALAAVLLAMAAPSTRGQAPAAADQDVAGALLYVNDGDIVLQPVSVRRGAH